jgi:hypothetical protein
VLKYFLLVLVSFSSFAQPWDLKLTTDIYHNNEELFHSHQGPGPFDSALAMSIQNAPLAKLRLQIDSALGIKLDYFKGWNPEGEAHVTVVTPVEFFEVLKSKLTMSEIEAIADKYDIQESRLMILGLGSAKVLIDGKEEETFFVIVDSAELRNIRQQIFYEFTRRGGDRSAFDPTWFFPHITIGYTKRDLHEADGIKKNLKYSLDKRFTLRFQY